jgi:hypothetical protein
MTLRRVLHAYREGWLLEDRLAAAARMVAEDARQHGPGAAPMLVALKRAWAGLAELRGLPAREARALRDRLVTLGIRAYYAPGGTPGQTPGARAGATRAAGEGRLRVRPASEPAGAAPRSGGRQPAARGPALTKPFRWEIVPDPNPGCATTSALGEADTRDAAEADLRRALAQFPAGFGFRYESVRGGGAAGAGSGARADPDRATRREAAGMVGRSGARPPLPGARRAPPVPAVPCGWPS